MLRVSDGKNALLTIAAQIEDMQNKTTKESKLKYAFQVQLMKPANSHLVVAVQVAGVVVQWRAARFERVQNIIRSMLAKVRLDEESTANSKSNVLSELEECRPFSNELRAEVVVELESLRGYWVCGEVCMGVLRGEAGRVTVSVQQWEARAECVARNLEYQDCTAYPHTVVIGVHEY